MSSGKHCRKCDTYDLIRIAELPEEVLEWYTQENDICHDRDGIRSDYYCPNCRRMFSCHSHGLSQRYELPHNHAMTSKVYILIHSDVDLGHQMLAGAHGSAMLMKAYGGEYHGWWKSISFRKVICECSAATIKQATNMYEKAVTEEFGENAKGWIYPIKVTESGLNGREVAVCFPAIPKFPKKFGFLRLFGAEK